MEIAGLEPETSALTMRPPCLPTETSLNVLLMPKVNLNQTSSISHQEISISCMIQECDNVTNPGH